MPDNHVSAEIEFPHYSLAWIRKVCQQFVFLKHITYPKFNINQIHTLIGWKFFDLITSRGFTMYLHAQQELFRQNLEGVRQAKLICLQQ